ncbi:surface protein, putative [Trichomonas vaginalis G3]|uniref:Surface protein, putative n=1 Tax=Trichomonas vaginalis (strain ATCC PRA-98 / G3) TaxID=412133 RepID=A2G168_TRIV3|nr:surface protein, putative [Trichomonas vaginalis G3]|eukprot:XP_001302036.1 surface protein [Trichomonas vaginalis G3]
MFYYTRLKNITLPQALETIDSGAFVFCLYLEEFFSNSPNFVVKNKVLYNSDFTVLVGYPSNCYEDILDTVTEISSARGFSSSSFTRFTMRQTISKIGPYIFRGCQNLEYADISAFQVNRLYDATFYSCNKLKILILPSTIQTIEQYAFSGIAAKFIVLPFSLKSVSYYFLDGSYFDDIYYCGPTAINAQGGSSKSGRIHVSSNYPPDSTQFLKQGHYGSKLFLYN